MYPGLSYHNHMNGSYKELKWAHEFLTKITFHGKIIEEANS